MSSYFDSGMLGNTIKMFNSSSGKSMFSNCEAEAILYYLYMMADGEVSFREEKIFDKICKELKIEIAEQEKLIEKCKEMISGKTDVLEIIVSEGIDKQAVWRPFLGRRDASSLARITWNLVNLGYADLFYSDEEKKIVHYLVDKWSISSDVYQEFVDTADTMLALGKQKEWIISKFSKGSVRDKKEKEIDLKIKQLLDEVKLTIEEITM